MERLDAILVANGMAKLHGHSLRIGGATQLLLQKWDPTKVKQLGRWKSEAFSLYWRHICIILSSDDGIQALVEVPEMQALVPVSMLLWWVTRAHSLRLQYGSA
jgi:hypothetical protein